MAPRLAMPKLRVTDPDSQARPSPQRLVQPEQPYVHHETNGTAPWLRAFVVKSPAQRPPPAAGGRVRHGVPLSTAAAPPRNDSAHAVTNASHSGRYSAASRPSAARSLIDTRQWMRSSSGG